MAVNDRDQKLAEAIKRLETLYQEFAEASKVLDQASEHAEAAWAEHLRQIQPLRDAVDLAVHRKSDARDKLNETIDQLRILII